MVFLRKYLLSTTFPFSSAVAHANVAAAMELSIHGRLQVLASSEQQLQGLECCVLGKAGGYAIGFASTLPVPKYVHLSHQSQHSKRCYGGKPH